MSLNLHWTGQRPIFENPCHWTVLERAARLLIVEALVVGMIESLDNVSVDNWRRSAVSASAEEKKEELLGRFFALSSGAIFLLASVICDPGEDSLKRLLRLMIVLKGCLRSLKYGINGDN